ncbi:MAG: prohibitin family protein [Bacteroidetes bacterium]|jgi:regulator of protease activity HflC (stomatin/prohibitin superfamily)|nr:prohibitin family protein [Bacteroidota bacterium]MBK9634387.1 prohibitin family protein [Bacteroidota bacterium]MBL0078348.1 prohibitin family protein [Bacteroidota bacterium]MBL0288090.1 prohibitin family protein [Bacteroidota bacterium]MBP7256486.1 prohibitin family protein [Chitinophagales bacterium]
MILLTLGILAIAFGLFLSNDPRFSKNKKPIVYLGLILLISGVFSKCITIIKPGNVGVKVLFGRVFENDILENGMHVINPLMDIEVFNSKTQNYTMSGIHDEGNKEGDDAIKVLSSDGLEITMDLSVLYKVNPKSAPKILKEIGSDYQDVVIRPITRTRIRDNAVFYQAVDLFSARREEFQNRIFKTIQKDFEKRGLILEQLLIRNITLPESVKKSIEAKINAEQESQKMQFVLAKEKQEAERKRVEAQGIADYQKIISVGLSDNQLQFESIKAMKELAKSENSKIIVMGSGKNSILLNTGQ